MPEALHIRKQLRDRAVTALTGLAITQEKVFASRVYEIEDSELPCLLISTEQDSAETGSMGYPRLITRTIYLVVKVCVKSSKNFDDKVDAICLEVEEKLASEITLGGLCMDLKLLQTTMEFEAGGESAVGFASMVWQADIRIVETTPDTAI
ncbi:MAG: hypothetical protein ACAH12_03590 [Methylophilaceae bacterium]